MNDIRCRRLNSFPLDPVPRKRRTRHLFSYLPLTVRNWPVIQRWTLAHVILAPCITVNIVHNRLVYFQKFGEMCKRLCGGLNSPSGRNLTCRHEYLWTSARSLWTTAWRGRAFVGVWLWYTIDGFVWWWNSTCFLHIKFSIKLEIRVQKS